TPSGVLLFIRQKFPLYSTSPIFKKHPRPHPQYLSHYNDIIIRQGTPLYQQPQAIYILPHLFGQPKQRTALRLQQTLNFLFQPHTLTFLLSMMCTSVYVNPASVIIMAISRKGLCRMYVPQLVSITVLPPSLSSLLISARSTFTYSPLSFSRMNLK